MKQSQQNGRFAWLLPVTEGEVHLIASEGWSKFKDEFERAGADVFDLRRPSTM